MRVRALIISTRTTWVNLLFPPDRYAKHMHTFLRKIACPNNLRHTIMALSEMKPYYKLYILHIQISSTYREISSRNKTTSHFCYGATAHHSTQVSAAALWTKPLSTIWDESRWVLKTFLFLLRNALLVEAYLISRQHVISCNCWRTPVCCHFYSGPSRSRHHVHKVVGVSIWFAGLVLLHISWQSFLLNVCLFVTLRKNARMDSHKIFSIGRAWSKNRSGTI